MNKNRSKRESTRMAAEVKQLLGTRYPQTNFTIDVKSHHRKLYANLHWEDSVPASVIPVSGRYDAYLHICRSISNATLGRTLRELHRWDVIREISELLSAVCLR